MFSLTILSENLVRGAGLLGEHGLAYWLDTGTHRVLFDTGQGMALLPNARRLGIDLAQADAIVLSHGHYDHVSGLPDALAACPRAALWMHPGATMRRYQRTTGGKARRLSTDFMEAAVFGAGREVRRVTEAAEVVPGLWVTGPIERIHPLEDTGGPFFLDEELTTADPIADDMAVYGLSPAGLSVVLGCCHAGLINTLQGIFSRHGPMPLRSLVGGLHLMSARPERVRATLDYLREVEPAEMGFGHCTGAEAVQRIRAEFPGRCREIHAGWTFPGGASGARKEKTP